MPVYQCPRCNDVLVVEETEGAFVECPCWKTEAGSWFVRVGQQSVGPLSAEAIREMTTAGLQVRREDGDWAAVDAFAEFETSEAAPPDVVPAPAPQGARSLLLAIAALFLVIVAASGWMFHFMTPDVEQPPQRRPRLAADTDNADAAKSPKKPVAAANQLKVPPEPLPELEFEDVTVAIKPVDKNISVVAISVTVPHDGVWKRLKTLFTDPQIAAAFSMRIIGDRELKFGRREEFRMRQDPRFQRVHPGPPMRGDIKVSGKSLRFEPVAPLMPGERDEFTFNTELLGPDCGLPERAFRAQYAVGPQRPRLVGMHPQSSRLPVNLTALHLVFSEPMKQKNAGEFLILKRTARGNQDEISLASTKLLWSKDGRRCSIPLRGDQLGPTSLLKTARRFQLIISGEWQSAAGLPIRNDISKTLYVGRPDDRVPDPKKWHFYFPPTAGKTDGIRCRMREPFDWASFEDALRIVDPDGKPVAGKFTHDRDGSGWSFRPAAPWKAGNHEILISGSIRSLSGKPIIGTRQTHPLDPTRKWIVNVFRIGRAPR